MNPRASMKEPRDSLATPRSQLPRPFAHFAFAKIMDSILPLERGEKYEDPLSCELQSRGLGLVTGGGTQTAEDGSVAWVGLDLSLSDLDEAPKFACQKLKELGAPPGSVVEYCVGDRKMSLWIA
jgi:hypothetical protein